MRLELRDYKEGIDQLAAYRQLKKSDYVFVLTPAGVTTLIIFGCQEVRGIRPDEEVEYTIQPGAVCTPGAFYFLLNIVLSRHNRMVKLAFDHRTHKDNLWGLAECPVLFLMAGARPGSLKDKSFIPVNKLMRLYKTGGGAGIEMSCVKKDMIHIINLLAVTHALIPPLTAGTLH